jgi:hypothetical protein
MVAKSTFSSLATALVDIPPVSMSIAHSLNSRHLCHCDTTAHFSGLLLSQHKVHLLIMLFNQLLDMPHQSGGWIILAKEKCSIAGVVSLAMPD